MRVAVIDVGSNSVRLLIASVKRGSDVRELAREREYLRLGDDAYRLGRISERKLDELSRVARRFTRRARTARVDRVETIVTAPGRQAANGDELLAVLGAATGAPVVQLTAEDEGRLAWHGAVAALDELPDRIGVVDLGGGSCEVAIGSPEDGPGWVCSRDAGALRVTRELLSEVRPSDSDLLRARVAVCDLLDGMNPASPDLVLAVGEPRARWRRCSAHASAGASSTAWPSESSSAASRA